MKYSDKSYNLRIQLDTKDCEFSAGEIEKMEQSLDPLDALTRDFPISDLYVTVIHHPRTGDFHVKTSLKLSGKTLFTGDRDTISYAAYERCVRKLCRKVEAYKSEMSHEDEISKQHKGTHHEVLPTGNPDADAIAAAIDEQDYMKFRKATDVYEEPIRKRVGRWIQRYPELEARLGDTLSIADIVEEVFLNAFESYGQQPAGVHPGEWLESLVDPSVRDLLEHPDEELENVRFAQTLQDAERELESRNE